MGVVGRLSVGKQRVRLPVSAAGTPAPPATFLEPATTGSALLGTDSNPITTGQGRQNTLHHTRGTASALVVILAGSEVNTMSGESLLPSYTWEGKINSALLGQSFPVTKNGVSPVTKSAIEYWVECDPIEANWPDNDTLTAEEFAVGARLPGLSPAGTTGSQLFTDEALQVAASGLSLAAQPTDSLNRRRRMCTIAGIARRVSTKWAVTTLAHQADSRGAGQTGNLPAGYASADHLRGPYVKAMAPHYAGYNLGIGADQSSSAIYTNRPLQRFLERQCKVIIGARGINEMENRQLTGAQGFAFDRRNRALYAGQGYVSATVPPRSSSTDGFITEANQTPVTTGSKTAEGNNLNTLLRASGDKYWDLRAVIQGANTDVYKAPGGVAQTIEGLHENPAGIATEVADAANLKLAVDTALIVAANSQPPLTLTLSGTPTFSGGKLVRGTATGEGMAASALPSAASCRASATASGGVDVYCGTAGRIYVHSSGVLAYTRTSSGTSTLGTTQFIDGIERYICWVTILGQTYVYVEWVPGSGVLTLEISYAFSTTSANTGTRLVATVGNGTGTLRDLCSWAVDRTGAAIPAAGAIPAAQTGLVGYWPLASNGDGQFGPWLGSI